MSSRRRNTMVKGKEHVRIEQSKPEAKDDSSLVGVIMEVFETEFTETGSKEPIEGRLLRPTRKDHLSIADRKFKLKAGKKRIEVKMKYWMEGIPGYPEMEQIVCRGLRQRHYGILRPLICSMIDEFSKSAFGCKKFDYTLQQWFDQRGPQQIPSGVDYLSDQGKSMIRSAWTAIDYIWEIGCTCDGLDQASSYVVDGPNMMIIPSVIRPRRDDENNHDHKVALRTKFANLLNQYIGPLWNDDEFYELTSLMTNPRASSEVILGHPVLSSPVERQLMYQDACSTLMTAEEVVTLNTITVDANWVQAAKNSDAVLDKMLLGTNYSPDAAGASHFARIVSSHYCERMKEHLNDKNAVLPLDLVDKLLKRRFHLMLCKWYALKHCHEDFQAQGMMQMV